MSECDGFLLVSKPRRSMVSRPQPLLLVIMQAFEVETFSVCETSHLQIKWRK